jgi:hypothetical protein
LVPRSSSKVPESKTNRFELDASVNCFELLWRTLLSELLYRIFVSIHRIPGAKSSGYFIGELLLIDTLTATASVSSELL